MRRLRALLAAPAVAWSFGGAWRRMPSRTRCVARGDEEGSSERSVELVFRTDEASTAEELSELLLELGASFVEASDAGAGTAAEESIYREPGMEPRTWRRSIVRAVAARGAASRIASALGDAYPAAEIREFDDDVDWLATQEALRPPVIIGDVRIVLPWHDGEASTPLGDLRVEGGAAFGTGEHPTTRMCALWLQRHLPPAATVLDYGAGSGVLALVALKAGAASAVGVDLDPEAVAASRRNAQANGLEAHFYLPPAHAAADDFSLVLRDRADSPLDYLLPDRLSRATYDVVVANILLNPLLALRDTIAAFVDPTDGVLLLSGIRRDQFDALSAAYTPRFDGGLRVLDETDGWLLVLASKTSAGPSGAADPARSSPA